MRAEALRYAARGAPRVLRPGRAARMGAVGAAVHRVRVGSTPGAAAVAVLSDNGVDAPAHRARLRVLGRRAPRRSVRARRRAAGHLPAHRLPRRRLGRRRARRRGRGAGARVRLAASPLARSRAAVHCGRSARRTARRSSSGGAGSSGSGARRGSSRPTSRTAWCTRVGRSGPADWNYLQFQRIDGVEQAPWRILFDVDRRSRSGTADAHDRAGRVGHGHRPRHPADAVEPDRARERRHVRVDVRARRDPRRHVPQRLRRADVPPRVHVRRRAAAPHRQRDRAAHQRGTRRRSWATSWRTTRSSWSWTDEAHAGLVPRREVRRDRPLGTVLRTGLGAARRRAWCGSWRPGWTAPDGDAAERSARPALVRGVVPEQRAARRADRAYHEATYGGRDYGDFRGAVRRRRCATGRRSLGDAVRRGGSAVRRPGHQAPRRFPALAVHGGQPAPVGLATRRAT